MDLETTKLSVETVAIERLFCSPSNPQVAASIRRFGFRQPIVAKPSGEVIAGNTRLKAAQSLGLAEVPVAWFDGSDLDATAYAIADNRTAEFAEWDEQSFAALLATLRAEDARDGVGLLDAEIDALLADLAASLPNAERNDPGPEERPEHPVWWLGDLWLLGEHRLLCGDSTKPDALARLRAGEGGHQRRAAWPDLDAGQGDPPGADGSARDVGGASR
jgi:ParB-like chromosome segregation protein Spo0J